MGKQYVSYASVAVTKTMTKSSLGRKGTCFILHFQVTVHHRGESSWELKTGNDTQELSRNLEKFCFLVALQWLAQSFF